LAFGLKRRSVDRAEISHRVAAVADTLGLTGLLQRKPHALSGGQRQRVALGRAIVRDPKVFLFDEPLSNLDASLRVSTRGEISKLHRRLGATMIYVTHDQVEAMTLGQRICIMNGGKIVQVGPPLEVYKRPTNTFVASFLGNPPMNLLSAQVAEGKGRPAIRLGGEILELEARQYPALPAGAAITLGIRPESIAAHASTGANGRFVGIEAEIVQIESLGAETILTARISGIDSELVARVGPEVGAAVGERRSLWLDLAAVHLFDATGTLITAQAGASPP